MRRRLRKLEIDSGFKDDDRDIEPEDSEEEDDDDDDAAELKAIEAVEI